MLNNMGAAIYATEICFSAYPCGVQVADLDIWWSWKENGKAVTHARVNNTRFIHWQTFVVGDVVVITQ